MLHTPFFNRPVFHTISTTPYRTYSFSKKISILRTQIPQLPLLPLRQPQIPPSLLPPPILPHHRARITAARQRTQAAESDTNPIPGPILRLVLCQKRIRRDDAADVAKANLPGGADGAAVMAAQVEVEPADDDGQGGVDAHGDEEEGGVFEVGVFVGGQEDGEAGDGDGGWEQSEKEAMFGQVGEVGDDQGEDEGGGPGGNGVELGADLRVAVGGDDARGEEGVAAVRIGVSDFRFGGSCSW